MYKLESLRAHLLANVPGLQPEGLHTFAKDGHIQSTAATGMGWVYHFTAEVILTDYAGHADQVVLPLLQWLHRHQPELFLSRELMAESVRFEVDVLNHQAYDFGFTLKLSERVTVQQDGETAKVQHHGEPPLDPYEGIRQWQLFVLGELVQTWKT